MIKLWACFNSSRIEVFKDHETQGAFLAQFDVKLKKSNVVAQKRPTQGQAFQGAAS